MTATTGCDTCNKSTLSILLLRPSPIANSPALAPPGSNAIQSDASLTAGLLPARLPTESRFALRLLRAGYLHVYIPKPPAGTKNWLIYRVTEDADLVPQNKAWFAQPGSVSCSTKGHNAVGMKLLDIPQAHKIDEIWIAYSANLWNITLQERNKANPETMQKVTLKGASPNTFQPTVDNLKAKVIECTLTTFSINKAIIHDYEFNSMVKNVDSLVENMVRAAACHPKTKGKELAVVLRDPVGIATELNGLRLYRNELWEKEKNLPQNVHPMNSSNMLTALQSVMLDEKLLDSFEQVSPLRRKAQFELETWPTGTEWQALTAEERKILVQRTTSSSALSFMLAPYKTAFEQADLGRVIFPDADKRAAAWAKKKVAETWEKMTPYYDDNERKAWLNNFYQRMEDTHHKPLEKFEQDWRSAAEDKQTLAYFKNHFDSNDPNDPRKQHSPGIVYSKESLNINSPAPFSTGSVLDSYVTMLDKTIQDESAIVLRALVGNQESVIQLVHTQLTGDSGTDGMRDKTFDFLKGLGEFSKGKAVLARYSWMGDSLAFFSVGQLSAIVGAVMLAAARHPSIGPNTTRALGKLQHLWGIQQALEMAVQGAMQGNAPRVPVLVTMKAHPNDALAIFSARAGQQLAISKTKIKRHKASNSKIAISFLTDTDSIKAAQGNIGAMTKDANSGSLKMGKDGAAMLRSASEGSAVILSEQQLMRLYTQQANTGTTAVNLARSMLKGSGKDIRSATMTMEGRLALGSVVVQGIGLINGLIALGNSDSAQTLRDSWYGICDSTAGTLGGLLQLWAVVLDIRTVSNSGASSAAQHLGLGSLRIIANLAGAAGGIVNTAGAWAKEGDAKIEGDTSVATLYQYSGAAFVGTAATSGLMAIGTATETLIARGVGGALARSIALRVGANGTLALVGGTALTVSGVGLVLLGAGIAFQIGAIALTPTALQRWISRSYFGKNPGIFSSGKRDDMFKKGDWNSELENFKKIQEDIKK